MLHDLPSEDGLVAYNLRYGHHGASSDDGLRMTTATIAYVTSVVNENMTRKIDYISTHSHLLCFTSYPLSLTNEEVTDTPTSTMSMRVCSSRAALLSILLLFVTTDKTFAYGLGRIHSIATRRKIHLCATKKSLENEIRRMEIDVMESTQKKMDVKRVTEFLDNDNVSEVAGPVSGLTVSLSAGIAAGVVAWIALQNLLIALCAFVAVSIAASGDPLDDDSAAGAFARLFGRFTFKSWQTSKPKIKAVVKAAVQGEDEVSLLKVRLQQLEEEVRELRLWKQRRVAVDESQSSFTLDELKDMARKHDLKVGGSKVQLMLRLVESGVLRL